MDKTLKNEMGATIAPSVQAPTIRNGESRGKILEINRKQWLYLWWLQGPYAVGCEYWPLICVCRIFQYWREYVQYLGGGP